MFIDAIVVTVRDGQVTNRPADTAIGVTADGTRDILGIWIGQGGEGAKLSPAGPDRDQSRGTADVCIVVVCDGLKGFARGHRGDLAAGGHPDVCVGHRIRNTFRLASPAEWDKMARDLRPADTAPTEQAAKEGLADFNAN